MGHVSLSNSATFRRHRSRVRIPHGPPQITLIHFEFLRSDRPWVLISHFVPMCSSSTSWTRAPALSTVTFGRVREGWRPYHNTLCSIAICLSASQIQYLYLMLWQSAFVWNTALIKLHFVWCFERFCICLATLHWSIFALHLLTYKRGCALFILACCHCADHLFHVLNDLLLELSFAASKKGLGIVGKCETAACKLALSLSDYTVLVASIMDIAQYCV